MVKSPKETNLETAKPLPPVSVSKIPEKSEKPIDVVKVSSLDSIISHVENAAPEPNTPAIARVEEKEKIASEEDQTEKLNAAGNRRGMASGSKSGRPKGSKSNFKNPSVLNTALNDKDARCFSAGAETIEAIVNLSAQTLGPEFYWRPAETVILSNGNSIVISERERGRQIYGDAFVYKQWEGPNPLVSMFVFSVGFVISRLNQPETKKKTLSLWNKIKLWNEKRKLETTKNAHTDSGDN